MHAPPIHIPTIWKYQHKTQTISAIWWAITLKDLLHPTVCHQDYIIPQHAIFYQWNDMQCKFKRKVRLSFKLIQSFSKDKKWQSLCGHDNYIDAAVNYGHPWKHFAQGALTGTAAHSTFKSSKTNSRAALGFRMVENDEQCNAGTS